MTTDNNSPDMKEKTTKHIFQNMPPDININDVYASFTKPWNRQNRYRVRSMNETDIAIVVAIERDTWGDESWSSENFRNTLRDPLYSCWILESITTDYVVLGYGLQYQTHHGSHIVNLCLHPSRRGRGLGRILLGHMIDYTRENDGSLVELEVSTSNTQAFNLYVQNGFKIVDYLPHYYAESSDAYKMALKL
jgi:ribosomal-protein-alanine N-acetyltransferase